MNLELWQQEFFLQGTLAPTFPRAPRTSPLRVRPQRQSRRQAGAPAAAPEVANSAEPPKAGACEHARRRPSQRGPGCIPPGCTMRRGKRAGEGAGAGRGGALTVLLLVAGELEFAAQVGLSPGPGSLAGQGGCQQEEPEEEHWAERAGARSAGTWGAGLRAGISAAGGGSAARAGAARPARDRKSVV